MKRMSDWFHLKPDFSCFLIDPVKQAKYLFGEEDRHLRDEMLLSLQECSYSQRGQHAIIWGAAGRGKTHLAHHLLDTVTAAQDGAYSIELVYVDCPPISSAKAPVNTLLAQILKSIPVDVVKRFVTAYLAKVKEDPSLKDRVTGILQGDGPTYQVIEEGLHAGTERSIRANLAWLGGELVPQTGQQFEGPKQITDEAQLARNVGAIGEVLLIGEGKNLIFLVDEAERLQTIISGEHYWIWLSALRELFRKPAIGLILFIIASGRDDVPQILWQEEISSVIGANNIYAAPTYAKPHAESFLKELLSSVIQRDPIPTDLAELLQNTGETVETYPFTSEAFEEFVGHYAMSTVTSIPREIINGLERCARRAMTLDKKFIDLTVLKKVIEGV